MMRDERAISDLMAFMFIITVMIASIGLVATLGFEMVHDVRDRHAADSAQDGFVVIADQVTGIADHHAPARAAEFRLAEERMVIEDEPRINVSVAYNEGEVVTNHSVRLRSLEYQAGDTRIAMVGGAVLRIENGGSVMIREPPWRCGESQARINLIALRIGDRPSVSGEGTIQVQTRHDRTRVRAPVNRSLLRDGTSVTIEFVDDDRPEAWDRYFDDPDNNWDVLEPGTYECSIPMDDTRGIFVRTTSMTVDFTG